MRSIDRKLGRKVAAPAVPRSVVVLDRPIYVVIPRPVWSLNDANRAGWRGRHRIRKWWEAQIELAVRIATGTMPQRLAAGSRRRVTIARYSRRRIRDRANLIGGCKQLIDAIVALGLIIDDDQRWLDDHYRNEIGDPPRTEILIEESSAVDVDQPVDLH